MVREGDALMSPRGTRSRVLELATCTETGTRVVIHASKAHTYTTPLSRVEAAYRVIRRGGKHGDS